MLCKVPWGRGMCRHKRGLVFLSPEPCGEAGSEWYLGDMSGVGCGTAFCLGWDVGGRMVTASGKQWGQG